MKNLHTHTSPPETATAQLLVTTPTGHRAISPLPSEPISRVHPRHILVPTDFSAASKKAIEYAIAILRRNAITRILNLNPYIIDRAMGQGSGSIVPRIDANRDFATSVSKFQSIAH